MTTWKKGKMKSPRKKLESKAGLRRYTEEEINQSMCSNKCDAGATPIRADGLGGVTFRCDDCDDEYWIMDDQLPKNFYKTNYPGR